MLTLPKARTFGGPGPRPTPKPRAPLPPFDRDSVDPDSGAPLPVHTLLPAPEPPSVRYRRENFCGMRVAGLPSVPGGSADPSLVFMPFLDRYSEADQERILDAVQDRGYTHITLSWPDSRAYGTSIDGYVAVARRAVDRGLFVDHHWFSKVYDPAQPDPASVFPVLDALRAADAIQCGTVAWEMNLFVPPEWCDDLIEPLAEHAPEIPFYLHFSTHYASWPRNTGDSSGAFWNRRAQNVVGVKYQCAPITGVDSGLDSWTSGMAQARIEDVLDRLKPGGAWGVSRQFDVIAWETTAQAQFNGAFGEDVGDMRGFLTLAAPGPMSVRGFGNGARMPDGSVI